MAVARHQPKWSMLGAGRWAWVAVPASVASVLSVLRIGQWGLMVGAVVAGYVLSACLVLGPRRVRPQAIESAFVPPSNLPPPPTQNVGRQTDAAGLAQFLVHGRQERRRIAVVSGVAGIGKTSFALHVAHRVAGEFAGGELFAHLDADNPRRSVLTARRRFIAALSPGQRTPNSRLGQWYRYRRLTKRLTASNRLLIVLDDVGRWGHVRPLLPRGNSYAVIITSRRRLGVLRTACHVELAALSPEAARTMLGNIIGEDRVRDEDEVAGELVRSAAYHPLAIRLVGMALANRPSSRLSIALDRMLQGARGPDERGTFDNALDLSYAMLTRSEQHAVDALGQLDRRQFSPWELARLLRGDDREAWLLCDRLTDAGLLERHTSDAVGVQSYRILEHVELYAQHRARLRIPEKDREASLAALKRQRREFRSAPTARDGLSEFEQIHAVYLEGKLSRAVKDARDAVARARERRDQNREAEATVMLAELHAELGGLEDVRDLLGLPLRSASSSARARACRLSAKLHRRLRQVEQARIWVAEAADLLVATNDTPERIRVLREAAIVESIGDKPRDGMSMIKNAVTLCESDPRHRAGLAYAAARVLVSAGDLAEAERQLNRGAEVAAQMKQDLWVAWIAYEQAIVALAGGATAQAFRHAGQALELFRLMRHRYGRAHCRMVMGRAAEADDDLAAAAVCYEEALETFRSCGDVWVEADAAVALAGVRAHTDPTAARDLLNDAIRWFGLIEANDRVAEAALRRSRLPIRLSLAASAEGGAS